MLMYISINHHFKRKIFFSFVGEYMDCGACKGTFQAWDHRMLGQLTSGMRCRFPAVLTHKCACDEAVVSLLRARTVGNSPTAMRNNLHELHSEQWLKQQLAYLTKCQQHKRGVMAFSHYTYDPPLPFPAFPRPKWFLAVYVRDAWSRRETLLSEATSVHGSILKIDSTKKITKKLQGAAAGSAMWMTNIGNERGEILVSVLTSSESTTSLQPLANGLMERYKRHSKASPKLLYTDRDCCSNIGQSKYQSLFNQWDATIRLDIWHYMRRIAGGCTTESHPLYGQFMSRLSLCIFEWDQSDLSALISAKKQEMLDAGLPTITEHAVRKAISKQELARHCRRQTRGTVETTEAVEQMLLSFSAATDSLGMPLLKPEITTIWEEQKKHVACIQDPPTIQLYTQISTSTKGGVTLPIYRCARGSTSLESFHSHLVHFVPGTSAGAVNFQAYIIDGLARWNSARASAATQTSSALRTFDVHLQHKVSKNIQLYTHTH